MIYTVHIYYSEQVSSDVEDVEVIYNYSYGKAMTAQKKPILPVPRLNKAR